MSEEYAEESVRRTPPQGLQAEQSVLGAMLTSKDAISDVVEVLRDGGFYQPKHKDIFESIINLYGRSEPTDPITATAEPGHTGDLQRIGGTVYFHDLLATISIAANTSHYAKIVREKAILRHLVNASIRIAQLGRQGQGEVSKIVDEAQQMLFEITGSRASEDYRSLSDLMEPTFDEMEAIANSDDVLSGVPTGFNELDSLTSGLHPGQMIIVVTRPGTGKSTFALDVCRAAAIHHGLTTVLFSLEMSRTEVMIKILSAGASVPPQKTRGGRMDENDWQRIIDRSVALSRKPLFIDDSPSLAMMEIHAEARHLKQRNNLQLACIDYIQLVTSSEKVESRQLEVSEFSCQIKPLAERLEMSVITLSQLSRNAEQRKDGVSRLADLHEPGSLEQDADIVIMLHRPELYTQNPTDEERGQAAFHILKYRNGQLDKIDALLQSHYSRFTSQSVATFNPA